MNLWDRRYKTEGELWQREASPTAVQINNDLKHPAKILEIGCGYGRDLRFLQSMGHMVTGLEISHEGRALAKMINNKEAVDFEIFKNISEILKLDFDLTFSHRLLHLLDENEITSVCDSIICSLKPGGFFYGSARDHRDFNEKDMIWIDQNRARYKDPNRKEHVINFWSKSLFERYFERDFKIYHYLKLSEMESTRNPNTQAKLLLMKSRKRKLNQPLDATV